MSQPQRSYRTHAVVLRRRDYGDADRILTVLTPGLGKQEFIAKGIRKTSSRKAGHLDLFIHAALQVVQARTWPIVTEAVIVESFRHLRESLEGIAYASYFVELVDSFSETDNENLPLWELLLLALRELDAGAEAGRTETAAVLAPWFELHLLSLSGFEPQLFACLGCERPLEPGVNYLSLIEGGVLCPACGAAHTDVEPIDSDVLKLLRFLQSRPWEAVRDLRIRPQVWNGATGVLRRYLLLILERHLKSVPFLRRLQAAAAG